MKLETREGLPYPGLRPFNQDEGHIFYGRHRHVNDLLKSLVQSQTVLVIGPSGCGKSSLVRPGLYDTLLEGNFPKATRNWRFVYSRPGHDPVRNLATGFATEFSSETDDPTMDALARLYEKHGISRLIEDQPLGDDEQLLILIDQFEELFSEENKQHKDELRRFVGVITDFCNAPPARVYMVITMRSDFIGDCTSFDGLAEVINDTHYLVPPLDDRELLEAIVAPAEDLGAEIEETFKRRLMDDVQLEKHRSFERGYDILPLIQHTMQRVWIDACGAANKEIRINYEALSDSHIGLQINLEHYEHIGPLQRALDRHANTLLEELCTGKVDDECKVLHRVAELVFKRLTRKTAPGRFVRSPADYSELEELCQASIATLPEGQEIRTLLDQVLETFSKETVSFIRRSHTVDEETLDIGHESLIRQWRKLTHLANEEARWANFFSALNTTSKEQSGAEDLLRGARLQRAIAWRSKQNPTQAWAKRYSEEDQDFVDTINFIKLSEDRERNKQRWAFIKYGLAATIVLVILVGWAVYNQLTKHRERERSIALSALSVPGSDPLIKSLLIRELAGASRVYPAALQAAHDAAIGSLPEVRFAQLHTDWVWDVAATPDGNIVTASEDGFIRACRPGTPWQCQVLQKSPKPIHTLAVNAGGTQVAAAGQAGELWLYNLDDPARTERIGSHNGAIWDLAFDHEGRFIVSAGDDGRIFLWPNESESERRLIGQSQEPVYTIDVDPKTNRVASGGADGRLSLWPLDGGEVLSIVPEQGSITSISFNTDGSRLAYGTADGFIGFWETKGETFKNIVDPTSDPVGEINRIKFRPGDDDQILVASTGRSGLWSISEDEFGGQWNKQDVLSIAFNTAGDKWISGDRAGNVEMWNALAAREPDRFPIAGCDRILAIGAGDSQTATSVICQDNSAWRVWFDGKRAPKRYGTLDEGDVSFAISADQSWIATGNLNGEVKLWQPDKGPESVPLTRHDNPLVSVAFGPDSIASFDTAGELRLTSLEAGNETRVLGTHEGGGSRRAWSSVVFSPDGDWLATGAEDGSIRLWPTGENPPATDSEPMSHEKDAVVALSFSPDGEYLATGHANGHLWLVSTARNEDSFYLGPLEGTPTSLIFHPTLPRLLSSDIAGHTRIWDLEKRSILLSLGDPENTGPAQAGGFISGSGDESTRVISGEGNTLNLWRVDWDSLVNYLENASDACLTKQERQIYLAENVKTADKLASNCHAVQAIGVTQTNETP